jgi:hypothetical protein
MQTSPQSQGCLPSGPTTATVIRPQKTPLGPHVAWDLSQLELIPASQPPNDPSFPGGPCQLRCQGESLREEGSTLTVELWGRQCALVCLGIFWSLSPSKMLDTVMTVGPTHSTHSLPEFPWVLIYPVTKVLTPH